MATLGWYVKLPSSFGQDIDNIIYVYNIHNIYISDLYKKNDHRASHEWLGTMVRHKRYACFLLGYKIRSF